MYRTIFKTLFILPSLLAVADFAAHSFETSAAEGAATRGHPSIIQGGTQKKLDVLPKSTGYIPPSESDLRRLKPPSSEMLSSLQGKSAGFLTPHARALTAFRYPLESFFWRRSLPTVPRSGDVVEAYVSAAPGPTVYVQVVVCNKDKYQGLVREGTLTVLTEQGYTFQFPGWSELGFLYARKLTRGKIFAEAPPPYEETKLVVKVDPETDTPASFITLLYEVNTGPRIEDKSSWKNRTEDIEAYRYIDKVRWSVKNILESALERYCGAKEGTYDSVSQAIEAVSSQLTPKQAADAKTRIEKGIMR